MWILLFNFMFRRVGWVLMGALLHLGESGQTVADSEP